MCNVLPKQSTGLFRRTGSTKTMCCLWGKTLTFLRQTSFVSPTHTPLALLNRFTARQRAECEGFVLSVNPSGASRHLPHWGRHPLDSQLGAAPHSEPPRTFKSKITSMSPDLTVSRHAAGTGASSSYSTRRTAGTGSNPRRSTPQDLRSTPR